MELTERLVKCLAKSQKHRIKMKIDIMLRELSTASIHKDEYIAEHIAETKPENRKDVTDRGYVKQVISNSNYELAVNNVGYLTAKVDDKGLDILVDYVNQASTIQKEMAPIIEDIMETYSSKLVRNIMILYNYPRLKEPGKKMVDLKKRTYESLVDLVE